MSENIHQRLAGLPLREQKEVTKLFDAILTDLANLRTDIAEARGAIVGITAQLDADEGVTDTDYASNHDPAALVSGTAQLTS